MKHRQPMGKASTRVVVLLIAGVMIGFAAFVGMLTPKQIPLEAIEFMPAEVDFGERDPNELARAEIVVSNSAGGVATITGILPSCACITVEPASLEIPAGDIVPIVVRMKMSSWQDQPIRFQLAVMLDGQSDIIVVPVKAKARQVFESEATRDEAGQVESLTIRAADRSKFTIKSLPWFAKDDASFAVANNAFTIVVDQEKAAGDEPRSDRDETPHIVLEHETIGEVNVAWRQPNAVPGPSSPPIRPTKDTIEVDASELSIGVPVQFSLQGPGIEDIPHISVTSTFDTEIWQMSMSPESGGLAMTIVLRSNEENWTGDTLVVNWQDNPACTVSLTPLKAEQETPVTDD